LALLFSLPGGGLAQEKAFLWDGNHWLGLAYDVKVGYIKGIGNLADYEVGMTGPQKSPWLSRAFAEDLKTKSIDQIVREVDKYYQSNPNKVNTPVIEALVQCFCLPSASAQIKK
jgi:hypothetical protein